LKRSWFLKLALVITTFSPFFCGFSAGQTSTAGLPSANIPQERLREYTDLAVKMMQEYLRINTTNPPGHELQAAEFFKKVLDAEGIENQVFEYAPGRADLWAVLPHTTAQGKRPIILLNHTDVVTSDAAHWTVPPFSGEIVKGSMYGRGAQDMKEEGLAQLIVMLMLKRERVALDRDVIFLAVADEEAEGTGTDWFIANKRDLLRHAEFLINEGGENLLQAGQVRYVGVDVGEKTPLWLHITAHGRPGHASRPIPDSAPNRLIRALDRLIQYQPPLRVLPVVDEFFKTMAPYEPPERARMFADIKKALQDKTVQQQVTEDESINFLLRDTISVTMFGGSKQTNVIPPDAWANVDVRLLPGADPKTFLESIRKVVNDPNVTVQPQNSEFRVANSSPTDTVLYSAIRKVTRAYFGDVPVAPRITSGYTENQRYRPLGIEAYGFTPYATTEQEGETEHGNDERVRVEELRRAPKILYDVVTEVAGAK
jgi:acetylornithine deacetylase/succinyl-diaminopimelate desuccinylase-like protein